MSPADRIQQLLSQKPGLKAQQIAAELGLDRRQVASALHALAGDSVVQDNAYRWWPKADEPGAGTPDARPARTLLARLCRYYVDCLARESATGISMPAGTQDVDYVEISELPFAGRTPGAGAAGRAIKKIIRKARQEKGQLALYIGYAVRLRLVRMRDMEEMRIEPALLYPLEDDASLALRPASGIPLFNLEVLRNLLQVDSGSVIDEATHLSDELGLANAEEDLPEWDEIVLRLQHRRPEWDWRESLNPYDLSKGAPLSTLTRPGIYNRAVVFAAPRSPFTYGLETELRQMAKLDEAAVRKSVLGGWLEGGSIDAAPRDDRPVLELLPLNAEQRQAAVQGLSAPLTVVTGPPGTGKSQVVIALLANAAWQGASVLFASKNNHAVDVVESRANEVGSFPWLLRLGWEEHQSRLAQNLSATLAQVAGPEESVRYAWLARAQEDAAAAFAAVQAEIARVVSLRNQVDELERESETARELLGRERFRSMRDFDVAGARRRLSELSAAIEAARDPGRILPQRKWKRVADALAALRDDAERLGAEMPESAEERFQQMLAARVGAAAKAHGYWHAFDRLRGAKPLEQLAADLARVARESARHSLDLWRHWLRLWPGRWAPEDRKLLAEYVALLQMIAAGERFDEGAGRTVFQRYYTLFPRVTRLLPCWAVTSLSARGRLPFEAGVFDLVVIDEASQCDIASALPLLFRAKRAVIIGDPLQLKHVSTVAPQQDRQMLAAHGLVEGKAPWAYSVNSLFDLARSLCRHEDIVNLREHHRSHRDIISFSNRHFYRGTLRVATDHEALKRSGQGPAVRWVDIRGRVSRPARGGAINPIEAEAVVRELRNLVVEDRYNGIVGVVTPFRAQANRIRTLVHQDPLIAARLGSMQFVVDTVHGFQGDERDVILFSPVVSIGIGDSTLRFLKNHGNLFNVAITRARSELIVVGDRHAAVDSGIGYLASFAEYTRDLEPLETAASARREAGPDYPPVPRPELVSEWERRLYAALFAAGLHPVPQYQEGAYTLDFALFAGERKLDIEVDGEHYHRNWDGELCRRDQIRSRRLNEAGWDIIRFWVYELRDDLPGCVARAKSWAESRTPGIPD